MRYLAIFLAFGLLFSCAKTKEQQPTQEQNPDDKFRPEFHFYPPSSWMNDPNGMVYYEGEYHLFYQYYPDSNVWGPMHWGHAVSKDLVSWEHLPIALFPDEKGFIFSGSAVVDWKNTSGLGTKENPAMVAIFTYHSMELEKAGQMYQTQAIAYSLDKGRTWTKYDKNPVLPNPGINDFRDPKVFWHEPKQQWIMMLAVKDHVRIYASSNLKEWELASEFGKTLGAHGGVWECPDMFELQDETGKKHWVVLLSINPGGPQGGSATQYFVGNFDGKAFTPADTITRWLDYGADNYAGVTFNEAPDGRRIFMGWMSNWLYGTTVPTTSWRSAMTIPRELSIASDLRIIQKPVKELDALPALGKPEPAFELNGDTVFKNNGLAAYRCSFDIDTQEPFELKMGNEKEEIVLSFDGKSIVFDRSKSGVFHDANFEKKHVTALAEPIKRIEIWKDATSVEVFINGGRHAITEIFFPMSPYNMLTLKGKAQIKDLYLQGMRGIWK